MIEDLETIREEDPLQYANLKRQSIRSLVAFPLYDDGKIIGFYGVDNPHGKSLNYAQNMLQIMGYFVISALKRRDLLKQLRTMSYCDQLTGLGNRFAMDAYVARIPYGKSLGVVYCDITGLKKVNDTKGHKEGDRLILRAAECLKAVFGDYGFFRVGGDELLALCVQIEENTLKEQVEALKAEMAAHSVVMAVGAVWQEEYTENIDALLLESERLMYEDKAAYYKKLGRNRRK